MTHTITLDPGYNVGQTLVSADGTHVYVFGTSGGAGTSNGYYSEVIAEPINNYDYDFATYTSQKITSFTVSPDGKTVYTANANPENSIDFTPTNLDNATTASLPQAPQQIFISPDGKKIYVVQSDSSIATVSTTTGKVMATSQPLESHQGFTYNLPVGATLSPDGKTLYVPDAEDSTVYIVNTSTSAVTGQASVQNPLFSVVSSDNKTLYVSNDTSISVVNAQTGKLTKSIGTDSGTAAVAVSPDGKRLYVSNYEDGTVSVIDVASGKTLGTILDPNEPAYLSITPNGKTLFISNLGNQTVSVITLTSTATPAPTVAQTINTTVQTTVKQVQSTAASIEKAIAADVQALGKLALRATNDSARFARDIATFNFPKLPDAVSLGVLANSLLADLNKIPKDLGHTVSIVSGITSVYDLISRFKGIANGNIGDFLIGLVDVGAVTIDVESFLVKGSAAIATVTVADLFISGLGDALTLVEKGLK